jgi:O-antigen/teichoic acid export membrane protein
MSVTGDSAYRAAGSALQLATSLALGVLTARLLGPAGRGQLYLVIQTASLGALLLGAGLGQAYQYHVARGVLPRRVTNAHLVAQTFVVSLVVAGVYLFGQPLLRAVTRETLTPPLVLLACVATVVNVLLLYVTCSLFALPHGIRTGTALGAASSLLNVALVVALVGLLRLGATGAVWAWLASLGVQLIPAFFIILSGAAPRPDLDWVRASRLLYGYGASVLVGNLMISTVFRIDVFIVNALMGAAALGTYSVAVAFAELVLLVPNALGTVLFAHLPQEKEERQVALLAASSRVTVLVSLLTGTLVAALSYPLVTVLMGGRFIGAAVPLCCLVPGLIAMSANFVYANFFSAQGKPLVTAAFFLLGAIINVILNLIAIPALGLVGAALASTVAYAAVTASFVARLRQREGLTFRQLFIVNAQDREVLREKLRQVKTRWVFRGSS